MRIKVWGWGTSMDEETPAVWRVQPEEHTPEEVTEFWRRIKVYGSSAIVTEWGSLRPGSEPDQ